VAALRATPGETYNVGGGETVSVWDVLNKLERIMGRKPIVKRQAARAGDQRTTIADTTKLSRHLGWHPRVGLDEGLARQVEWQRKLLTQADSLCHGVATGSVAQAESLCYSARGPSETGGYRSSET
jgi:UDP-glucose 4-epimerase